MWKLSAMRDMNVSDPLPPLGEKLPPPAAPAPPAAKQTERIVEGPDGKLSTNFPENERAAFSRSLTGRISSGPAPELHNLPKFSNTLAERQMQERHAALAAAAAEWQRRAEQVQVQAKPYGYGPTAERLLAEASRADFAKLEERVYDAAIAECLLDWAKEQEKEQEPAKLKKRIEVTPRPHIAIFDDLSDAEIYASMAERALSK